MKAMAASVVNVNVLRRCMCMRAEIHQRLKESIVYDEAYKKSEHSFYNIPVESIGFRPVQRGHFEPQPEPFSFTNTSVIVNGGIRHMTPFSNVNFAFVGLKGNLGSKRLKQDQVMDNPLEAVNEIAISDTSIHCDSDAPNGIFLDYLDWLRAIRGRMLEHILDNISEYPMLARRYGHHLNDSGTGYRLLDMDTLKMERYTNEIDGRSSSPYVVFRNKLFFRSSNAIQLPLGSHNLDIEMARDHNLLRVPTHVFDRNGQELPLLDRHIRRNDVVAVMGSLRCISVMAASGISYGFSRRLESITILRRAYEQQKWKQSPNHVESPLPPLRDIF